MSDPVVCSAVGIIDGANQDFETTVAYYPGTVFAFLNGLLVQQTGDEGPVEQGGRAVRMRRPPHAEDTLHFWFQTGPPTPGAFLSPPSVLSAIDLVPEPRWAADLVPDAVQAIDLTPAADLGTPHPYVALDLSPKAAGSLDLVPKPVSSEEV